MSSGNRTKAFSPYSMALSAAAVEPYKLDKTGYVWICVLSYIKTFSWYLIAACNKPCDSQTMARLSRALILVESKDKAILE